ncbi:MAG: hypothetical protein K2X01_11925, partial [Cyanobacteria bacterium]|nr:hypothetical protein [Cyanobacteriota bacterium]
EIMSRFSDLPINNDKLADNYDDFLFSQVYPAMAEINQVNTTTDYRNEQLTKRLLDNLSQDGPWDLASEKRPEFPNRNTYKPFKSLLATGQFFNGFTAGIATAASGQQPDIVQIPYSDHAYLTKNYEKAGVSPIAALAGFNHYYGNDDWQTWDYPVELAYNTNSIPYRMPKSLIPFMINKISAEVLDYPMTMNKKAETIKLNQSNNNLLLNERNIVYQDQSQSSTEHTEQSETIDDNELSKLFKIKSVGSKFKFHYNLLLSKGWDRNKVKKVVFLESRIANWVFSILVNTKNKKIDWYIFPKIVRYVADISGNDENFKVLLWLLFGTSIQVSPTNVVQSLIAHKPIESIHSILLPYTDSSNTGLPKIYKNGYINKRSEFIVYPVAEQFHHYLGSVTGDLAGSDNYNNSFVTTIFEIGEAIYTKTPINQGDINLFQLARNHRDYFKKHYPNGRFALARELEKMFVRK